MRWPWVRTENPLEPLPQSCAVEAGRRSYSWEGEDVVAWKLFADHIGLPAIGCFVDIGAHHPIDISNTFLFYMQGWRGINIDATPGSMELFRKYRPEDVNLELAIGPRRERLSFTMFSDPALNGFVDQPTIEAHRARGIQVLRTLETECRPIDGVLLEHLGDREIDLMNLDIEGKDIQVLETFDFARWRPKMIILEILGHRDLKSVVSSREVTFLESKGYSAFSRLDFSTIFLDRRFT